MSRFAGPMSRLIDELKKLPGIGSKNAQRLAFFLLRSPAADVSALAEAIRDVKAKLHLCSVCNNITDVDPCVYCASATRNQRLVCVVEEATNVASIEKTRHYNGVYHVLHGSLSPLHGIGPDQLKLNNLTERIAAGEVDEVIIATNPTVEGEATAVYISRAIRAVEAPDGNPSVSPKVRITRIATGLPAGADIEYADEVTMAKSLEGRREL